MRAAVPSLPEIGHSAADIGRTAAEFARRSPAPATESAYASDWVDFAAWCDRRLPVGPQRDPQGLHPQSPAGSDHGNASARRSWPRWQAPRDCTGAGRGIRRTYGTRQVAKRALLTEDLRRIVRKLRVEKPGGCRDRAVLLVGFGAALRRSELIALDVDDITISQAGLTILVRRSKTDQEGQGREIGIPRSRKSATCPVAALEAWLALAKSPIDSTYQEDREQGASALMVMSSTSSAISSERRIAAPKPTSSTARSRQPPGFSTRSLRTMRRRSSVNSARLATWRVP
jgi:integrase